MKTLAAFVIVSSSILMIKGDKSCTKERDCRKIERCVKQWSPNNTSLDKRSKNCDHDLHQQSTVHNSRYSSTGPCTDERRKGGSSMESKVLLQCYLRYQDGILPDCCTDDTEIALKSFTAVEQFEKCAPRLLPEYAWRFYLEASGHRNTFEENFRAFRRLRIIPRIFRGVPHPDMSTSVLNQRIPFPIGLSPVAFQKFASPLGEIDTIRAVADAGIVMIVSSHSSTTIEDISKAEPYAIKWMQTYFFKDRNITLDVVHRAEKAGFKALVLTVDCPIPPSSKAQVFLNAKRNPLGIKASIVPEGSVISKTVTFKDISWLKNISHLPIVVKGVLTGEDAVRVAEAGASAILVSNHGGRQLDFVPSTIDSIREVADALQFKFPSVEIYLDGGVRNGRDIFKAIALGARMVFMGRPIIWGLSYKGERGLRMIFDILKRQLKETMHSAGTPNLHSISRKMIRRD